ncbi:MAG: rod shape-determining protein MreD [Bacteroidales bacterium]|nr:rod shape-determining protein MreD [Bacteroidales bacterium]MCM1148310.1 rod shape-determining protein MreD [Bacteroidales bacterium]MCM1206514.1 rod shape-determining protein MreD [Bacillota bacterium]MCM1510401.1 rod shape-determining protein MreD [Clostridium sp.]
MSIDFLKRLAMLAMLILLQALVLNHIHIFNCATPLLYILIVLHFSTAQQRWSALLWSFTAGLLMDIFSNTPGVAAASMTFIGFLQPAVLRMFLSKESIEEGCAPSLKELGWLKFFSYTFIITFTYCLLFCTLEAFSFFNIAIWAETVGGSTLITLLMLLAVEKIRQ